jgi:23S rRNA (cytidine1920-2'-O)/16S rRNA (cytidine1409-2'-O)-methyltransferase
LLVDRGFAPTRSQAQALLLAGKIRVGPGDGGRLDRKPGDQVDPGIELQAIEGPAYVSRGGDKLAGALDAFGVDPSGRVCIDVGASTGGFTDCLLRRGAKRIYALDVGRGQLAESLRGDPRVVSMERVHAARLDPGTQDAIRLPEPVSLAVVDVSFISLTRLLRPIAIGLGSGVDLGGPSSGDEIVALVKPQFELSPKEVPRGVVRKEADRKAAVQRVRDHAQTLGLEVLGEVESPLVGPAGNHEFFLYLRVPPGWRPEPEAEPTEADEPIRPGEAPAP